MIYERLTQADISSMRDYMVKYAGAGKIKAPMENIFYYWDKNKEHLYKLFGDNFIISKKVKIEKPYSMLADEFFANKKIMDFQSKLYRAFDNDPTLSNADRWDLYSVARVDTLIHNKIDNIDVNSLSIGDVKIQRGMKAIRAIEKLVDHYNLSKDVFEEFRLEHSRMLNLKYLAGELCLSIHPLDYMTMSDNDSGWSSCMKWRHNGGYRRGTVEMMNSDCVIVAYLKANDDMKLIKDSDNPATWNNKKWRSLFIVRDEVITNVKHYPFFSKDLNDICLEWLSQLVGGEWSKQIPHDGWVQENYIGKCRSIDIEFGIDEDNAMYNDFGAGKHYAILSKDFFENYDGDRYNRYINYAGVATCMCCGNTIWRDDMGDEGEIYLCCSQCLDLVCCEGCHILIDRDSAIEYNGDYYCSCCFDDMFVKDFITGEAIPREESKVVRVYINEQPEDESDVINSYSSDYYTIRVNEDFDEYKTMFTEEIAKIKVNRRWYVEDVYCSCLNNLTVEGRAKIKKLYFI